MDQLQHQFRKRLIKAVTVLSKLVRSLDAGSPGGYDVMRRLAAELRRSSESNGYPQILAAAVPFESAPPDAYPMLARRLLRVVEAVALHGWDVQHRILVIDADEKLGKRLQTMLAAPTREVIYTPNVREALQTVAEKEIALVVMDLLLPDVDGRNLISRLRKDPRTATIPIVVLSDWGGHDLRAECFALGADQFFQKSGDLDLLSISVASSLHRSINQVRDTHHDGTTSLLSREGLREKYTRVVEKAKEKSQPVTVVVVDIDQGPVVDHSPEQVLRAFVRELHRVLRPTDLIGRWNESELLLVLSDTNKEGARRALERVREFLSESPLKVGRTEVEVEFSQAVVEVKPDMALDEAVTEGDRQLMTARLRRASASDLAPLPGSPQILLADPDAENVFFVRQAFEREGFEVQHFDTARGALKAARVGRVSLILVDLQLPDMSGLELVERLRKLPRLRETPLLMTSNALEDEDEKAVRAFELGVDDYVFKPTTSNALVARMRRLLKRAGPSTSGPFKVLRKTGAMAGLFASDQLLELVQMIGLNRKTGRLVLSSDTCSGHIDFSQGMVTKAWSTDGEDGAKACDQLFSLESGRFEFWPGQDVVSTSGELVHLNVNNLLLDAMRRKDEAGIPPD